jgi:PAS domain S-box-containing protein
MERAIETGEQTRSTCRYQPTDGEQRFLRMIFTPAVTDGERSMLRGAIHDITSEKKRQHELRQIETLFQQSHEALYLIDVDDEFTVERVNPAWEAKTGRSAERVRGQTPRELLGESQGSTVQARYRECVERREPLVYTKQLDFGKKPVRYETRIAPVVFGDSVEYIVGASRDVTEQKEQQRRFRALTEQSPDLISVADVDGRFQYASPSWSQIMGYDPDELIGDSVWAYVHPDDRADLIEAFENGISDSDSTPVAEFRARHADGSWRWLEARGNNQLDNPAVEGYVVNQRDVTERKERERELEETSQQYETVVQRSQDGIRIVQDGTVEFVNNRLAEMLGYPREKLVGMPAESVVAEDDREMVRNRHAARMNDQAAPDRYEVRLETNPGGTRHVELSVSKIQYEGEPASLSIIRDITERKEREQSLEQLHSSMRELLRTKSTEEVATVGSKTAAKVLDLQVSTVFRANKDDDKLVPVGWSDETERFFEGPPPTLPISGSLAGDSYQTGQPAVYADVREVDGIHNPETEFRSELYVPLGDYGVLVSGSTACDEFDTEDKALAQVLGENIKAALDRVERVQELERQNQRLEEFTSIVSHDLRNPLNMANLGIELAQKESESPHLDEARRGIDQSLALIDDLLTLAREGEQIGPTEPVDFEAIVTEAWGSVDTAEATLHLETDMTIHADRSRLRQLLVNLFQNAIDHGGEDVTVTVEQTENGFVFEDDGPGIPAGDSEAVFQSGYSTAESGTGFGLRIVDQVASGHGWDVSATDGTDGGARFEISGVDTVQ